MKRIVSFLLFLTVSICLTFSGCTSDPESADVTYTITKSGENRVEIYIDAVGEIRSDNQIEWTLIDVMEDAKECGKLTYEISGGMITSIEGKANAADFSSCWMLYTSDTEMSNTEWGTIQLGAKTLGSAIVGVDSLPVTEGEIYVWEYVTF